MFAINPVMGKEWFGEVVQRQTGAQPFWIRSAAHSAEWAADP